MNEMMMGWQVFLLSLGRVSALVAVAPVIGGLMVPNPVKIMVSVVLTVFIFPALVWPHGTLLLSPMVFGLLMAKEVVLGLVMAFTLTLCLTICQTAGEYMGFQMMFSAGQTFAPLTQEQSTITGNFVYFLALLLFVAVDGHHILIRALVLSFSVLPVMRMPDSLGPLPFWIQASGRIFEVGLRLSLPVVVTLLLTNLVLGMVARTMPQINVFVIGLPVQLLAGIFSMAFIMASLTQAELGLFKQWARELYWFIHWLAA